MKKKLRVQPTTKLANLITLIRALVWVLFLTAFARPVLGGVLIWDAGNTNNGAVIDAASGTWDTSSTNLVWNNGAGNMAWPASPATNAVFAGADAADGTYVITVGGNFSSRNMWFQNNGYTLTATTPRTISLSSVATAAVPSLYLNSGKTATIGTNVTAYITASGFFGGIPGDAGNRTLIIDNGGTFGQNSANTPVMIGNATIRVKTGGTFRITTLVTGSKTLTIGGSTASTPLDNSLFSVEGGTLDFAATTGSLVVGGANNGTLTVTNGSIVAMAGGNVNGLTVASTAGATGTVNLDGGTISVSKVAKGAAGTAIFNFNGGTLKTTNNNNAAIFMKGLDTANIRNGGALIDNNGFAITIGQTLLHSTIGGDDTTDGGLIVTNSGSGGMLTLTNANTYNGPTIVKSGAYLATMTASSGAGAYAVSNNATLEAQVASPGGQLPMNSLTLGASGSDTLTNIFTLGANASTTTPAVTASGALNLNGAVTVNVTGSGLTGPNTYLLMSYGAIAGSGSFVAGSVPTINGYNSSIVNDTTANQLKLVYTAVPASVKWAVGDGNWDTSTPNWQPLAGGAATTYTEAGVAAFDDSASGTSPIIVTLTGDRSPNTVTNNSTKNYIFAGSAGITSGNLIKDGSSILLLDNSGNNGFASLAINAGTLQVGNNNTNGSIGTGNVIDNGALTFNRTDSPVFANVISGTGGVIQNGSGSVTFSGANTYAGNTTISAGKLTTTTASTGAGAFTVNDGATLEVQVVTAGKSLTNSSLTLGTSGSLTNFFTLGANGRTTVPVIQDNGDLTLNGTVTVNVTGTGLAAGTYPLISYASITGSGTFAAGNLPVVAGCTVTLFNDTSANQLKLVCTAFTALTWDSGDATDGASIEAGSGTWDKNPTNIVWNANNGNLAWQDSVGAIFAGSDGTWAIDLATNVICTALIFNNSGYTLSATSPQTNSFSVTGTTVAPNLFVAAGTATIGTNVTVIQPAAGGGNAIFCGGGGTLIIDNGGTLSQQRPSSLTLFGSLTVSVKTGGVLQLTDASSSTVGTFSIGSVIGDNTTLSVDGGTVSIAGTNNEGIAIGNAIGATGTLTINAGTVSQSALNPVKVLTVGSAAAATGTVNLNGGLLAVTCVTNTGGTGTVNFNSGTLRAVNNAFASSFLSSLSAANVQSGGAVIDNNGFAITVPQPLLNGGGTDGGLTSLGTGSLTLTGANTYNGNTVISAGTLTLTGSGSISSSASIIVAGGAIFDVSGLGSFALASGQILGNSTPTATLNGNVDASGGTVSLTYASGTPSFVVTNGTLALSGSTAFNVNNTGSPLTAGSYKIISKAFSGSVAGTVPSVTVSSLASGATAALQITSGELFLVVTGGTPPPAPRITTIGLNGTTLTITATNGAPNGTYKLLQSTNVALPLSQWTPVLTNNFDNGGNLSLSTNIIDPNIRDQFYILSQ